MNKNILKIASLVLLIAMIVVGCTKAPVDSPNDDKVNDNAELGQKEDSNAEAEKDSAPEKTSYPFDIDIYGPDGTKYTQTILGEPAKVVTNNPSSTDLLLELGLEDKIVGIMQPDNAPQDKWKSIYEKLTVLGDKMTMSKEIIVGTEPDLIFGRAMPLTDKSMGEISDLNEMGINVYTQYASNFIIDQSIDNVILDVRNIGKIFNVQGKANEYADSLQARLDAIKDKVSSLPKADPVKVLYMVTYVDGTFNTFGANSTFQSEMLKTINAENVLDKGTSSLTSENLIALNPDVIVYVNSDRNAKTDVLAVESILNDETIQSVPAIENKKIIEIGYDELMDYGVRIYDTLEKLYEFIYQ